MSDGSPFKQFDAINALVDGGWLRRLREIEKDVALVYIRRANTDGIAWPKLSTVAGCIGHRHVNHVCAARKRLEDLGILTRVRNPEDRRNMFRVSVPAVVPNQDSPESGNVLNPASDLSQIRTTGSPESGKSIVPNRDTEVLIEEPTEVPTKRTKSKPRFSEGDCERVYLAYPRREGKRAGMREIGNALERISKRANAPADPVAWLIGRVQAYAAKGIEKQFTKLPGGWFKDDRFDDDTLDVGADEFNIGFEEPSDAALECLRDAGNGSRVERTSDGFLAVRPSHEQLNQLFQRHRQQTNPDGTFKETVDASSLVIDTRSK